MNKAGVSTTTQSFHQSAARLFQAATLALLFAMTISAHAADRAIKSRVPPVYPDIAKRMKIMGAVKIEATVDATGNVTAVKTLEGNHMLSSAAEDAVRKWRFEASTDVSTVEVTLNFQLAQ